MYMVNYLGNVEIATLAKDSSSLSTWYIPMFNYVGTVYISQFDSGTNLIGSGVLSTVSTNGISISRSTSFWNNSAMSVNYNNDSSSWGLQFTNVTLASYSLVVMFVGIKGTGFAFQGNNPAYSTYTITGTSPSSVVYHGNYTTMTFLTAGTSTINFNGGATFQGNGNPSGYTTYTLNGTSNTSLNGVSGSSGAGCAYLQANQTVTGTNVGVSVGSSGATSIITIDNTQYKYTVGTAPTFPFSYNNGGTSTTTVQLYPAGGGGSAGPAGPGTSTYNTQTGGAASTGYNNVGLKGNDGVQWVTMKGTKIDKTYTYPGTGGGGTNGTLPSSANNPDGSPSTAYGATGAVVLTLSGKWQLYITPP